MDQKTEKLKILENSRLAFGRPTPGPLLTYFLTGQKHLKPGRGWTYLPTY